MEAVYITFQTSLNPHGQCIDKVFKNIHKAIEHVIECQFKNSFYATMSRDELEKLAMDYIEIQHIQ